MQLAIDVPATDSRAPGELARDEPAPVAQRAARLPHVVFQIRVLRENASVRWFARTRSTRARGSFATRSRRVRTQRVGRVPDGCSWDRFDEVGDSFAAEAANHGVMTREPRG